MDSRTDLCGGCRATGIPTATQVPNPKTDPEMAPIYRAQDDWPPIIFPHMWDSARLTPDRGVAHFVAAALRAAK